MKKLSILLLSGIIMVQAVRSEAMYKSGTWVPSSDSSSGRFGGHWEVNSGGSGASTGRLSSSSAGESRTIKPVGISGGVSVPRYKKSAQHMNLQNTMQITGETHPSFRGNALENISACKNALAKLATDRNGWEHVGQEVSEEIRDTIAPFDASQSLQLQVALQNLTRASASQVAEVYCAVDQLADVIDVYNHSSECVGQSSCNVKELSRITLGMSLDDLKGAVNSVGQPPGVFDSLMADQSTSREIGKHLLDLAIGLTPGVSNSRDFYEAVTGRNLMTGENLSIAERSFAILCALPVIGNGAKAPLKIIEKISEIAAMGGKLGVIEHGLMRASHGAEKVLESAASLAHTNPDLGRKLDYVLGKATGSAHNVERSQDMLRQMERIGFPESQGTRTFLADHLKNALNDPTSVLRTQENGRVVRESLLNGQRGSVKVESIWEDAKLITVKIFGGG